MNMHKERRWGRNVLAILDERPRHRPEIARMTLDHANLTAVLAADLMIANSRQRCAARLLRTVTNAMALRALADGD